MENKVPPPYEAQHQYVQHPAQPSFGNPNYNPGPAGHPMYGQPAPNSYYAPQPQYYQAPPPTTVIVSGDGCHTHHGGHVTIVETHHSEVNHCLHFCISLFFWPWIVVWIALCIAEGS